MDSMNGPYQSTQASNCSVQMHSQITSPNRSHYYHPTGPNSNNQSLLQAASQNSSKILPHKPRVGLGRVISARNRRTKKLSEDSKTDYGFGLKKKKRGDTARYPSRQVIHEIKEERKTDRIISNSLKSKRTPRSGKSFKSGRTQRSLKVMRKKPRKNLDDRPTKLVELPSELKKSKITRY